MVEKRSPCSIVLEGGVTSALIYAGLLCRLSRHYTFRQLGGTSSGAMAAAAAAAAEYGRQVATSAAAAPCGRSPPPADPFVELGRFPDKLAMTDETGGTRLLALFRPHPMARAAFRVVLAVLARPGKRYGASAVARGVAALWINHPGGAVLASLLAAVIGWLVARWVSSFSWCGTAPDLAAACAALWVVVMLPTLLGAVVVVAAWAVWRTVRALRANHWGLCSGMPQAEGEAEGASNALMPTLHKLYQSLSGKCECAPLTFGDLWGQPDGKISAPWSTSGRQIDLQIVTTSLGLARPLRIPGEPGTEPLREFFYDPDEWATLFPKAVMQHLKIHGRPSKLVRDDGHVLWALPPPQHLPVLVAARLSLSFPLLLSAIPMYVAVPRPPERGVEAEPAPRQYDVRKTYFSDGGITSNCPVHLFDAPLPGFPTFAINLYRSGARRRSVTRADTQDPDAEASTIGDAACWRDPLPFLQAILHTSLDWRDSLQRRMPSFRDRVVHIGVPRGAGGLNLTMPPHTIRRLGQLGQIAARRLHRDFALPGRDGAANAWERHRWTRARTTLSALRAYLATFVDRLATGEPDYVRLLRAAQPADHAFPDDVSREQALDLIREVRSLMRTIDATTPPDALDQGAPHPRPKLHLSPPW